MIIQLEFNIFLSIQVCYFITHILCKNMISNTFSSLAKKCIKYNKYQKTFCIFVMKLVQTGISILNQILILKKGLQYTRDYTRVYFVITLCSPTLYSSKDQDINSIVSGHGSLTNYKMKPVKNIKTRKHPCV